MIVGEVSVVTKFPWRGASARPTPNSGFSSSGFTLIELLVVILIGGILAAIAIPTFLNRANAAKQVEAKTLMGQLNRAQQAFYTEHHAFATDFESLAMSIGDRPYYTYTLTVNPQGPAYVAHYANPKTTKVRAYAGMTGVVYNQGGDIVSLQTILCEAEDTDQPTAPPPQYGDRTLACAPGTQPLH